MTLCNNKYSRDDVQFFSITIILSFFFSVILVHNTWSCSIFISISSIPNDGGPPKHIESLINTILIVYYVGIL
jgi:hypothetical protein